MTQKLNESKCEHCANYHSYPNGGGCCRCGATNSHQLKEECACHEPHISSRITHTKERCYVTPLPSANKEPMGWEKELLEMNIQFGTGFATIHSFIQSLLLQAEKRAIEKEREQAIEFGEITERQRIVGLLEKSLRPSIGYGIAFSKYLQVIKLIQGKE